jgi:hypothetical protein
MFLNYAGKDAELIYGKKRRFPHHEAGGHQPLICEKALKGLNVVRLKVEILYLRAGWRRGTRACKGGHTL